MGNVTTYNAGTTNNKNPPVSVPPPTPPSTPIVEHHFFAYFVNIILIGPLSSLLPSGKREDTYSCHSPVIAGARISSSNDLTESTQPKPCCRPGCCLKYHGRETPREITRELYTD
eukprot:scaffold94109_cov30-Attheya_sp.AAC.1